MINVAVLGLGWWGPKLLRNLKDHPVVAEVIGVDPSDSCRTAIAAEFHLPVTADIDSVFKNRDIHGVVIATPPATHFDLIRKAFKHGKDVLVTKPPTKTIEELDTLVNLAKNNGCIFMMDSTFVYSDPVRKIRGILDSGLFKDIRFVQSLRYGNDLRFHHISRLRNTMLNNGINVIDDLLFHDLAILTYLLPDKTLTPTAVHSAYTLSRDLCDTAFIRIDTDHFPIHIGLSWPLPERRRELLIVDDEKQLIFDDLKTDNKLSLFWIENQREELIDHENTEPLSLVVGHFLTCMQNRKTAFTDGRYMLRMMESFEKVKKLVNR